jgi:hypothetical protein
MLMPNGKPNHRRLSQITTLVFLLAAVALLLSGSPALAQDYRFSVPQLQLQVFVQPDGSARIVYDIEFENAPTGRAIDIVDIGMPGSDYNLSSMQASLDGIPMRIIRPSEYVQPGVEIPLGSQSIAPGQSGTLQLEFTMPDLVFQDVTNRDLASLQITPTWFDERFVLGSTLLQIAIHVPEGVSPEELLHQNEPFSQKALFQDRAVAVWEFANTRLTGPRMVGVSFPSRVMEDLVSMSVFQMAGLWFENQQTLRVLLGVVFLILFGYLYLRATGGTGITLFLILVAGLVYLFFTTPWTQIVAFIPLIPAIFLLERNLRRRKRAYLPAIAQVEGGGIKRGLTAPEAAALLEMPINKVLTLVMFGMLKKGVLLQRQESPLEVEVREPFLAKRQFDKAQERFDHRQKAAQQQGTVVHPYEQHFLDVIEGNSGRAVKDMDFSEAMDWFLASLARRMKGFDLSDTRDYYRSIVKRAVDEAKGIEDIPQKEEILDRDMEWILLDDGYPTVFNTPTYHYRPRWLRPASSRGTVSGGGASGSFRPSLSGAPSFTNVASGFAGWTENTMASLAASIMPDSLSAKASPGGFIDLTVVDRTAGNVFEALLTSSESSGGGGSGGGCACACAGCACACACAGGGR